MNRIILIMVLLCGTMIFYGSCSKESDCDSHLRGSISEIEHKDSVKLGDTALYHIKVAGFNGCSSLESVTQVANGNTIVIAGNIYNKGCTCNQSFPFFDGVYRFIPTTPGTYILNFLNDLPAKYLSDTVVVSG